MKAIKNILLIVPLTVQQKSMPTGMNSHFWYAVGIIVAMVLLIYLVIALFKPEKF
jgi:K+-transporting ATPase KdpF subunit